MNGYPETHRKIVQFHPSYSYEDFVQGIKPVKNANGEVDYKLQPGIFQNLCNKAAEIPHDGNNHYFANVTDFQEISDDIYS